MQSTEHILKKYKAKSKWHHDKMTNKFGFQISLSRIYCHGSSWLQTVWVTKPLMYHIVSYIMSDSFMYSYLHNCNLFHVRKDHFTKCWHLFWFHDIMFLISFISLLQICCYQGMWLCNISRVTIWIMYYPSYCIVIQYRNSCKSKGY